MKKIVLLFAAFLTALAAQAVNINGYEIPLLLKPINKVDSFEWAATIGYTIDGEVPTAKDYTATPKTTYYETDYENLENWCNLPMVVSYKETYTDEATGETFTRDEQMTIKGLRSLKNLLKDIGAAFPPPWVAPTFKKEVKTCKNGKAEHIFGADCLCIVCKEERRDHYFEFVEDSKCARCSNYYDSYDTNKDGNLVLKEPQGGNEVCNATVPKNDPKYAGKEYHAGWHDEDVEDTLYNCSCECGYFAWNAEHYQHDFEAAKADHTGWSHLNEDGTEDTQNHWKEANCARCEEATMWISDPHTLEAAETGDGDYKWVDWSYHSTSGVCAKTCGYTGEIKSEHEPDKNCYCAKCGGYAHSWEHIHCATSTGWDLESLYYRCIHCGKCAKGYNHGSRPPKNEDEIKWEDEAVAHYYGTFRDEEVHSCYCGSFSQPHDFRDSRGDESDTCRVCNWTRTEESGTKGNKGDGTRGATCVNQNKPLTLHSGKDCSTTHFGDTCPAEGCGAEFMDCILSGGQGGKTIRQRLAELGISSVNDMPFRAYEYCVSYDNSESWMARQNWVTSRGDLGIALHDLYGYTDIADVFTVANRAMDIVYSQDAMKGEFEFLINLFGVPHCVTNTFTGKVKTTYSYDNFIRFWATPKKRSSAWSDIEKYLEWK